MNDSQIRTMLAELLQAFQANKSAQYQSLDQSMRLYNSQVNNAANASGLLYSTRPGMQQAQYLAQKHLPAFEKATTNFATNEIKINNSVQDALDSIAKTNAAIADLNAQ